MDVGERQFSSLRDKNIMLSPEAPHCLKQTGRGSRRFDNICMDILGPVDEGLIGANLKCTSQKHFSLENL